MSRTPALLRRAARATAALTLAAGLLSIASGTAATAHPAAPGIPSEPGAAAPAYGTIWVANYDFDNLAEFAPGATGDATPEATIEGSATLLSSPSDVAIDAQGRVWVADFASSMLAAFGPQDRGNAIPALTISGPNTLINGPIGMAISPSGDIWVASEKSSTILEFAPGSYGNVKPLRTISGPRADLYALTGIGVSPDGKHLWVTDSDTLTDPPANQPAALEEFSTSQHGNVAPLARIAGSKTGLNEPYGVVETAANSVITDAFDDEPYFIQTEAPGAHGNVAPKSEISGSNTGLDAPAVLALGARGDLWVPEFDGNSLQHFSATQHGNAKPLQSIIGSDTTLFEPLGVAVYATAPGTPASIRGHHKGSTLRLKWKPPHITGGGILGYLVQSSRTKSGHRITVARTTKPTYTKRHAKPGRYYEVEAFNDKGYSHATRPVRPKV